MVQGAGVISPCRALPVARSLGLGLANCGDALELVCAGGVATASHCLSSSLIWCGDPCKADFAGAPSCGRYNRSSRSNVSTSRSRTISSRADLCVRRHSFLAAKPTAEAFGDWNPNLRHSAKETGTAKSRFQKDPHLSPNGHGGKFQRSARPFLIFLGMPFDF